MNASDEYMAAVKKCRRLCGELKIFRLPEGVRYQRMDLLYGVDSGPLINAPRPIATALIACGGFNTSNLVYVDVRSPHKSVHGDAAYCNHMDSTSGVTICNENFKDRDENAPEKQLWPSKILWQSWTTVAKTQGSRPGDLKVIVRSWIVNKPTQRVIWQAAKLSTCTVQGPRDHKEYTEWDQGYHAILGSVNGASSMRMLLDHKAAISFWTIKRVLVLGKLEVQLGVEEPQARSVVFLLSSRRTPPTGIPRPSSTTRQNERLAAISARERIYRVLETQSSLERCMSQH